MSNCGCDYLCSELASFDCNMSSCCQDRPSPCDLINISSYIEGLFSKTTGDVKPTARDIKRALQKIADSMNGSDYKTIYNDLAKVFGLETKDDGATEGDVKTLIGTIENRLLENTDSVVNNFINAIGESVDTYADWKKNTTERDKSLFGYLNHLISLIDKGSDSGSDSSDEDVPKMTITIETNPDAEWINSFTVDGTPTTMSKEYRKGLLVSDENLNLKLNRVFTLTYGNTEVKYATLNVFDGETEYTDDEEIENSLSKLYTGNYKYDVTLNIPSPVPTDLLNGATNIRNLTLNITATNVEYKKTTSTTLKYLLAQIETGALAGASFNKLTINANSTEDSEDTEGSEDTTNYIYIYKYTTTSTSDAWNKSLTRIIGNWETYSESDGILCIIGECDATSDTPKYDYSIFNFPTPIDSIDLVLDDGFSNSISCVSYDSDGTSSELMRPPALLNTSTYKDSNVGKIQVTSQLQILEA